MQLVGDGEGELQGGLSSPDHALPLENGSTTNFALGLDVEVISVKGPQQRFHLNRDVVFGSCLGLFRHLGVAYVLGPSK